MSYDTIKFSIDERGVATLTLAREDKRNALSAEMISELTEAAADLGSDPRVRVVILTGAGHTFCAGGDLEWMRAQIDADGATRAAEARKLADMLGALNAIPKPLLGRIQGQAFGGGIGLMSVCDTTVGVHGAKFGLTEVRLGLIPATIGPYVVARMGGALARRVFFSGRVFDADEAVALGLLSRTVAAEDLDAAIELEVAPYLSAAPGAVAAGKKLVAELSGKIEHQQIDQTVAALVSRWEDQEATDGIDAFFSKKPPPWA